jgi:hypothetical protein
MPDRARATALTVTRNSTTFAKRRSNAQSALSPLQIALCHADKISAVPFSSTRRVNITTPRPLHDACSTSDLFMRLNGTEFDRNLGEIIPLRRSWPVKCEELTT